MGYRMTLERGGYLNCWEEGPRVFFCVETPMDYNQIYKVWICGSKGHELLLGTLAPERGCLRLFRTISKTELNHAGCWPVTSVRMKGTPAGRRPQGESWYWEEHPERWIADCSGRKNIERMLCHRLPEGVELAAPLGGQTPLPLDFLFCFARLGQINRRPYLIWSFDPKGNPKIPSERT